MSTPPPPPPPPFGGDSNFPAGGFPPAAPPGYAAYGQAGMGAAFQQPKTSGMAIASLVLSLVGLIPCFYVLQLPALLGVIFGFVGRSQIAKSNGSKKGAGLALAGIIIGIILLLFVIVAVVWARNHCSRIDGTFKCS